ncbi:MAG: hypothetical protein INR73_01125 [Williamsia sp.]|nr:hypothetical protein [Williamsia sp.]
MQPLSVLRECTIAALFFFSACSTILANCQAVPLQHAFAHNDYWHKRPLFDALEKGYTHIEADIYLRKGQLLVAHFLPSFRKKRPLESLYLKPLFELCCKDSSALLSNYHEPITLLIDVKSQPGKTYRELAKLLQQYAPMLSRLENDTLLLGKVTIVLSGRKPSETLRQEKNRLAFIDEDLRNVNKDSSAGYLYPMASCKYARLIKWKGKGAIPLPEKKKLCAYTSLAHRQGKKVRLWASPENKVIWRELLHCGVDLICTDDLASLKSFLVTDASLFIKQ